MTAGPPPSDWVGPGALASAIAGALRLAPGTYRAVSADPGATKLSLAVAAVAGAATAPVIGPEGGLAPALTVAIGIVLTLGILCLETLLVWGLARLVLRRPRSLGQVMRPLAIAHAPRIAYLVVPFLGFPAVLGAAVSLWLLGAFVVAVAAAIEGGWGEAVGVALGVGLLRMALDAAVRSL